MTKIARYWGLLWRDNLRTKPLYLRLPLSFLRLVAAVLRDLQEGGLRLRATSLVYTTLLALAPLLALCFSVLKGLGIHNQIEPVLQNLLLPLGDKGAEITERVVGFVANVQVGLLGAVGFAFLIYSVITLMNEIEKAFNDIWRVRGARSFGLRVRDHLSILLIGPLLLSLSVAITASVKHVDMLEHWLGKDLTGSVVAFTGTMMGWFLFAVVFAAIYMVMPNTRVRLGPALAAGALTGVMWKTLGWLFGVFVAGSAKYAMIYSAFAALVLFILWLYVGWLVVLIGASISYYLQNPSNQSISRRRKAVSLRVREKIALGICAEVGSAFYHDRTAPDAGEIARRLTVPIVAVEDVMIELIAAGIIAPTGRRGMQFIPGRPFDEMSVDAMLSAFRAIAEGDGVAYDHVAVPESVEGALKLCHDATHKSLSNLTLKKVSQ
ncbi:MAG: YihY/virulence factor BrkB family protein [Alphaproteobacteria bacterium]|nr:YihY/virulence factor BrkB family protein [Alphaproteobacteria bacterium]